MESSSWWGEKGEEGECGFLGKKEAMVKMQTQGHPPNE